MSNLLKVSMVVMLVFFVGCAGMSEYMQPASLSDNDMILSKNESAIVFLRPSGLGVAVQAPIAEFINDDLNFVAIISAKSKVFHKTTPGKHFLVVSGEGSDLLEANLGEGQTYYVYISPVMGFFKANFSFKPITKLELDSQEFINNLNTCNWHINKPTSKAWFAQNKESMMLKYQIALERHMKDGNDGTIDMIPNNLKDMKKHSFEGKKIIKIEYGI